MLCANSTNYSVILKTTIYCTVPPQMWFMLIIILSLIIEKCALSQLLLHKTIGYHQSKKHRILPQATVTTGLQHGARDSPLQPTGGSVVLLKTFHSQTELILAVKTQRDTYTCSFFLFFKTQLSLRVLRIRLFLIYLTEQHTSHCC